MTSDYQERFGGGKVEWAERGRFQLELLLWRGLQPTHKLLDVGCGPLRGGKHLIAYLNPDSYYGIDCNEEFIQYAVESTQDDPKNPHFRTTCNFESFPLHFDFILCFSVLNHCSHEEQGTCLQELLKVSHQDTKIIITHLAKIPTKVFDVTRLSLPNDLHKCGLRKILELTPNVILS